MKNFVLIPIMLLSFSVFAQKEMQWKAAFTYKQIVDKKMQARRDSIAKARPEMAEMMKKIYKKISNRKYVMWFNPKASIFKYKPKLEKSGGFGSNFFQNWVLYKDLNNKMFAERRSNMDDDYLIKDSLKDYHWKVTGERKKIGKFMVIKAEGTEMRRDRGSKEETSHQITAWFSPEITVSNGPDSYWGLPGFIMELNTGKEIYLCTEITVNPKDKIEIKEPKDGKVVNKKEYQAEMKKMREKMEKMYKNRRGSKDDKGVRITIVR